MRDLKALEEAIGKAVVDLSDTELSRVIVVLEGVQAARLREATRLFEAMIHPSWVDAKARPRNLLCLLQPRPKSPRGRKRSEDVSVEGIRALIELGRLLDDPKAKTRSALRIALKAYFRDTNRHRTDQTIEDMVVRLQKREIAGR